MDLHPFHFAFEELHCEPPYELLSEPLRTQCKLWTEHLYQVTREKCLSQASTLAEIDAYLSVFPLSRLQRVTEADLDVRHPFQELDVVRAGLEVPFADKLGSTQEHVYHRRKTLLHRRMPVEFQRCIPSNKVGYSVHLRKGTQCMEVYCDRLRGCGFLRSDAQTESLNVSTKLILASVARWVDAADCRGYSSGILEGRTWDSRASQVTAS